MVFKINEEIETKTLFEVKIEQREGLICHKIEKNKDRIPLKVGSNWTDPLKLDSIQTYQNMSSEYFCGEFRKFRTFKFTKKIGHDFWCS